MTFGFGMLEVGYRMILTARREGGEGLACLFAVNHRAFNEAGEVARIMQRLLNGVEAAPDGVDLPLVAGKVEQRGRVAPR